jgi:hypothetical protein
MFQTTIVEKIKTHFMFNTHFSKIVPLWNNVEKHFIAGQATHMTVWRMRNALWILQVTNTYSECVILIAFPLQQWLHERTLVLRYTYIACFVLITHKPREE